MREDRHSSLLDGPFLRELERLTLFNRRPLRGRFSGGRASPQRGRSVEFADFRDFVPGDDPRFIDWKAYARLGRLYVKLFTEEQDRTVHFFLDTSLSMDWGAPAGPGGSMGYEPGHKGNFARRLVAAMVYICLIQGDRVGLAALGGDGLDYLPPRAGRKALWELWRFIEDLSYRGETDLEACLAAFGRHHRGEGLSVLVSDLLLPGGYRRGLNLLGSQGQEVTVWQVLSPDELDPALQGDLDLIDAENGNTRELTVTPALMVRYRERVSAYIEEVAAFCRRRGILHVLLPSDLPLDRAIFGRLAAAGVTGSR